MYVVVLTVHWPADAHLAHEAAPHASVVLTAFHNLASHEVDHPLLTPAQGVDRLRAVHIVTCSSVHSSKMRISVTWCRSLTCSGHYVNSRLLTQPLEKGVLPVSFLWWY